MTHYQDKAYTKLAHSHYMRIRRAKQQHSILTHTASLKYCLTDSETVNNKERQRPIRRVSFVLRTRTVNCKSMTAQKMGFRWRYNSLCFREDFTNYCLMLINKDATKLNSEFKLRETNIFTISSFFRVIY